MLSLNVAYPNVLDKNLNVRGTKYQIKHFLYEILWFIINETRCSVFINTYCIEEIAIQDGKYALIWANEYK